jgi:Na+/proline symporter
MAVYCTTWTFYGSVGRAAVSGIGFLPVYLGRRW